MVNNSFPCSNSPCCSLEMTRVLSVASKDSFAAMNCLSNSDRSFPVTRKLIENNKGFDHKHQKLTMETIGNIRGKFQRGKHREKNYTFIFCSVLPIARPHPVHFRVLIGVNGLHSPGKSSVFTPVRRRMNSPCPREAQYHHSSWYPDQLP